MIVEEGRGRSFKDIPFQKRLEHVLAVKATIPITSIQIQFANESPVLSCGSICVDSRPFVFVARCYPVPKIVEYLEDGVDHEGDEVASKWYLSDLVDPDTFDFAKKRILLSKGLVRPALKTPEDEVIRKSCSIWSDKRLVLTAAIAMACGEKEIEMMETVGIENPAEKV